MFENKSKSAYSFTDDRVKFSKRNKGYRIINREDIALGRKICLKNVQ